MRPKLTSTMNQQALMKLNVRLFCDTAQKQYCSIGKGRHENDRREGGARTSGSFTQCGCCVLNQCYATELIVNIHTKYKGPSMLVDSTDIDRG